MTWRRLALLLLLTLAVRLPSFFRPIMDTDEAEYASIACRMLDGGLPYRDGVDIKFPGVLYVYDGVFRIAGRYNMLAIHLVCALVAFATALACRRIARRLAGESAGWWAAALYAVFSVGFYSKMQAANTEMFAVLPAALAVCCFLDGRKLIAGVLCGTAILFKQPAVLLPVGLAAGGLAEALRRRERLASAARAAAALAVGSLLPLGAVAGYFAVRGILDDAVFWTWTYIWRHYFPSVKDSLLLRVLGDPVPFTLSLAPAVVLAAAARGSGLWPVVAWLVSMFAAGFVGGRMYGHYFLLSVPPICVLAGVGAVRAWPAVEVRARLRRAVIAVTALLAAGQLVGATLYEGATDSLWSPKPDYRAAAARVRAATTPDERVFVWGWFPALYVASDRCPATRFVYTHHLAGFAANVQGKRGHSVPRGWDELMEDLHRDPPAYLLDTSHGDYEFRYAPIESYPPLWELVTSSYVLEAEIAGVRLYRRLGHHGHEQAHAGL
jgi:4-amino-4-deoxy-L-arabinose transferase-like glycosyltransferase